MWIRYVLLLLVTFFAGTAIAGAFVAFITLIGIIPALARQQRFFWKRLYMGQMMYFYECLMIWGVFFGTLVNFYEPGLRLGHLALIVFTFFGGMFTGCLAGALEETLNIFPIISRRTGIRHGMCYLLMAAAFGKCVGSLVQFYLLKI